MGDIEAIEVALDAFRRPQTFHLSRRKPLPAGMQTLLRIASASPEELNSVITSETAEQFPIREAAIFFLQQVLIKAEDDYRQLALSPGASLQDVKDHKRLLLKWLHPDRNRNRWESGLFQRVTASAERLETALRSGVQVEAVHFPERRKSHRKDGAWTVAQRRVKKPVGWKVRLFKFAVGLAVVVLLVALAQMALTSMQVGSLSLVRSVVAKNLARSLPVAQQAG